MADANMTLVREDSVEVFGGNMLALDASTGDVATVGADGQTVEWSTGGSGIPEGWTQAMDESIVVTLSDPESTPLTFSPPTGATDDDTAQIQVNDDTGDLVFNVDAAGGVVSQPRVGAAFVVAQPNGDNLIHADGAGTVGFFGATPVAQQEVTGALSSVLDTNAQDVLTSIIATLVALGLATDGTT